ncbi:MAG: hypothetical protein ACI4TD_00525 [Phocaeicola sp.]
MKQFIKVTSNGKKFLINVASIVAVTEDSSGCAVIHFSTPTSSSKDVLDARDSYKDVIRMMGVDLSEE